MYEFMKPWRRKFGVLMLIVACVFLGWWFRSSTVKDHLTRNYGDGSSIQATSFDGHFGIVARKGFSKTGRLEFRLLHSDVESIHEWVAQRDGWRWYWLGFGVVDNEFDGGHLKAWFAHLGFIVIPLTLLSAYLLLTNPKQKPGRRL